MKFKAVLFDLDGTLLNTLDDLADSTNSVLKEYGYPVHATEGYRYFVGDGFDKLIERTLPDNRRDENNIREAVDRLKKVYGERWAVKTKPYDGIPELLDRIADIGLKMVVLSNKPDEATKEVVAHFLSRWDFEIVRGARPSIPNKPDPAAALEIAGQLNLTPPDFFYLGDTVIDMQTAASAKMYAVGVLWGFREAAELIQGGARMLISHPHDLMIWL